jgi:hypothetical protein
MKRVYGCISPLIRGVDLYHDKECFVLDLMT